MQSHLNICIRHEKNRFNTTVPQPLFSSIPGVRFRSLLRLFVMDSKWGLSLQQ